ncbi:hypothetical protein DPMN_014593 [Dreissena polymorpha]|uniref:Uncharacterized protein n=1 Tax=Dreissena polymorpha TaxID=45954 RepID=A0A9D4NB86_DREPO|nr:hypothetical protein DPMN_014593 [Dreissena polymorpha]
MEDSDGWMRCHWKIQTAGCAVIGRFRRLDALSLEDSDGWMRCHWKIQTAGCAVIGDR